MKQKILLMMLLLCAVMQGAWADKWDGRTERHPCQYDSEPVLLVSQGAELAYIRKHWYDGEISVCHYTGYETWYDHVKFKDCDILLLDDIDLTAASWEPIAGYLTKNFNGNGHTIRLKIRDTSSNEQGLFKVIDEGGKIENLHIVADIDIGNSRKVGAICGLNYGTIENCWVSGQVKTQHYSVYSASLGGICGWNCSTGKILYCSMSGNVANPKNTGVGGLSGCNQGRIEHCTFYGTVTNNNKQHSKYLGFQEGTFEDYHDTFESSQVVAGKDMYTQGVKYPFALTITNNGPEGTCVAKGYDGETITRWHPGGTVRLEALWPNIFSFDVVFGSHSHNYVLGYASSPISSYTFDLSKDNGADYNITVTYKKPDWFNHAGTETDPYPISSTDDWNEFTKFNNNGCNFNGKYVKLAADIKVSEMLGANGKPFMGIFDGGDHTLTFNRGTASEPFAEEFCAPFRHVNGATIRNLKVSGHIYTSRKFAGGMVAHSWGSTNINHCSVATVIHSSLSGDGTHGGLVGLMDGVGNLSDCVYTGRLLTTNGTIMCGGLVGWHHRKDTAPFSNLLYAPDNVKMRAGETAIADGATIARGCPVGGNNYYTTTLGEKQGTLASTTVTAGEISVNQTLTDGNKYYVPCGISFANIYQYTGADIALNPTVKATDGAELAQTTDYTLNLTTVKDKGTYSLVITANGTTCFGTKTIPFMVADDINSETLATGEYTIHDDLTIEWRIPVSGDVVLNIAEGKTLTAQKGFELAAGNSLTINGPGALVIDGCDANKSGIGGAAMGALTINGGKVTINGGTGAAGIGADAGKEASGTVTLGWTDVDADFIQCNGYAVNSINFADGKQFMIDGSKMRATADNIGGQKIVPRKITGTGTQSNPYIINNVEDWNDIAEEVNSGAANGFYKEYLKLNADIEVTTMVGADGNHTFRGTFDGDGHTLTVNYTTDEQYAAPFHYTYGATIKNLKTAGTINTSNSHAGGVVGRNGTANTTLENVSSSVTISSTFNGRAYHGGLMGYAINATFTNCYFKGSLLGADSHHCGGLLGQKSATEATDAAFTNCLFAPTEATVSENLSHPFAAGDVTKVTINSGCYYAEAFGGTQGIRVFSEPATDEICMQVKAVDGNDYHMPCTVTGVQEGYIFSGRDITVTAPTVTAADGTVLSSRGDFTWTTTPATVKEKGNYTLTVSGRGTCSGSQSFSFVVGDYAPVTSNMIEMTGEYMTYNDVTANRRITINGHVVLNLAEGTTFNAKKGIELTEGNSLTIKGPGRLVIDGCDSGKSGIGAATMGALTIDGGQLDITGGQGAAGIGSDNGASSGTLTLGWYDDTDYVLCSSYATSVAFETDKSFAIDDDQSIANSGNIGGQKIVPAMVMADKGDNSEALRDNNGMQVAVALSDRTIYLDGKWNTLCLPFYLNIADLRGVEARTLTDARIEGSTLHLTFSNSVTELQAGVPYILKTEREEDYENNDTWNLVNPIFHGVTVDRTLHNGDYDFGSGDTRVRFVGTYDSKAFTTTDNSILLMGGENTLYYPTTGAGIGSCRAYFKIGDDGAAAPRLTGFSIDFGDGNTTALNEELRMKNEEFATATGWYLLDGRKVEGKPSKPGVYIQNGRKVVIK